MRIPLSFNIRRYGKNENDGGTGLAENPLKT
jgi:hypothetical protein